MSSYLISQSIALAPVTTACHIAVKESRRATYLIANLQNLGLPTFSTFLVFLSQCGIRHSGDSFSSADGTFGSSGDGYFSCFVKCWSFLHVSRQHLPQELFGGMEYSDCSRWSRESSHDLSAYEKRSAIFDLLECLQMLIVALHRRTTCHYCSDASRLYQTIFT